MPFIDCFNQYIGNNVQCTYEYIEYALISMLVIAVYFRRDESRQACTCGEDMYMIYCSVDESRHYSKNMKRSQSESELEAM